MFPNDFDPLEFFEGRTSGAAIVSDPFGRVIRRCSIATDGQPNSEFGALHFDETYAFDDGSADDTMHWAVTRTERTMDAAEPTVVGPVRSRIEGPCWRVDFKRRFKPPATGPVVRYRVSFCQLGGDLVFKTVRMTILGLPVARLEGFHRRL